MNKEEARHLLMDYLYEEIAPKDKHRLEAYLEKHPAMREELEQLGETRALLQRMPEAESDRRMVMVEGNDRSLGEWLSEARNLLPRTAFGRASMAVAAGLILLLFVGSVAKMHISYSGDRGLSLTLGTTPVVNEGLSPGEAQSLVQEIRRENAAMMEQFASSMNEQNREQLQQVVRYFQRQRMNDLQQIDYTLSQLQETTTDRFLQTNRFLGNLLQTANFQEPNQ
ncbi:MAG: hypothetical protein U5K31_07800 [Balneolaceae bacterium]|nr:hypothetical protein [Balneolaceae bacterium]